MYIQSEVISKKILKMIIKRFLLDRKKSEWVVQYLLKM